MQNAVVSLKLIRVSRIMAWVSLVGAMLYLLMDLGRFLTPDIMNATGLFEPHHPEHAISRAIPFAYRFGALVINLVPTALILWALLLLSRLFRRYARGQVFTEAAFRSLSGISLLIFIQVFVAFVAEAPITYVLSLGEPPGHREITLTFTSHDVSYLFMAGVVLVIARVMAEARRVADENASFV